jgi:uncharacterized protein (DUF433 family)
MVLEDYFDFIDTNIIRLKGHRIGIEHVIERYQDGASPEQIQASLPTLTLEEVYATITYYLRHQTEVDDYLARQAEIVETRLREYAAREPAPVVKRLRALKAERQRLGQQAAEESAAQPGR